MEFTYKEYEKMINTLLSAGYQIADYHNYMQKQRPCIIRHDVDLSLEKAVELSELETHFLESGGIQSTYFVLVTSDFYNIFSKRSQNLLKRILAGGHEIGLHFDEKRYPEGELKNHVFREAALLETVIEKKVRVVSMHQPSRKILDADINLEPLINSYSKKFFEDFKYLSDSRMHWKEDAKKIIQSKEYSALHILTHPIWYGGKEKTTKECIIDFLRKAPHDRYDYLDENFSNLQEYVKKEDI